MQYIDKVCASMHGRALTVGMYEDDELGGVFVTPIAGGLSNVPIDIRRYGRETFLLVGRTGERTIAWKMTDDVVEFLITQLTQSLLVGKPAQGRG